jgi:hypothetical protein
VKSFDSFHFLKQILGHFAIIHSVINHNRGRHSRESGNPGKHWIPGQARNDKPAKIYVVMYKFNGTSGPKLLEGLFVLISRKEKARFLKRAFSHS